MDHLADPFPAAAEARLLASSLSEPTLQPVRIGIPPPLYSRGATRAVLQRRAFWRRQGDVSLRRQSLVDRAIQSRENEMHWTLVELSILAHANNFARPRSIRILNNCFVSI